MLRPLTVVELLGKWSHWAPPARLISSWCSVFPLAELQPAVLSSVSLSPPPSSVSVKYDKTTLYTVPPDVHDASVSSAPFPLNLFSSQFNDDKSWLIYFNICLTWWGVSALSKWFYLAINLLKSQLRWVWHSKGVFYVTFVFRDYYFQSAWLKLWFVSLGFITNHLSRLNCVVDFE